MNIHNTTKYDGDLIVKYNRFYVSNYLKKNIMFIGVFTLGFSIYLFIISQWIYGLIIIGILILYVVLTFLMQKLTTKRILKNSPLVENPVIQEYHFTDEQVNVKSIKDFSFQYEDILKITESTDMLIFYLSNRSTYIVLKNGFDHTHDFASLQTFLRVRLPQKYK